MLGRRLVLAVLITALPAPAASVYSSFSEMLTNNPLLQFTNVSFLGLVGNTAMTLVPDPPGTVEFTNSADQGLTVLAGFTGWPGPVMKLKFGGDGVLTINLPANTIAVGGNVGLIEAGILTTVTLNSAEGPVTFLPDSNNPVYKGLVFASPITSLTISIPPQSFYPRPALNDFTFGVQGLEQLETPESSTMALIGGGLTMVSILRRLRRRRRRA